MVIGLDAPQLTAEIAKRVLDRLKSDRFVGDLLSVKKRELAVPVGVSVRHVHLCREHLDALYGKGYELTPRNKLYQRGEFAAAESLTIIGRKLRPIQQVRILGPLRDFTQVEIARTDAILLGQNPPVRPSGEIAGSEEIILVGPKGVVHLREGLIRANRHVHLSPSDATILGVRDNDIVEASIGGDKALIFPNVQIRVKDSFQAELHLDTDDANAAGIGCGSQMLLRPK